MVLPLQKIKNNFNDNQKDKQTIITQGKIVTSEIGEPEIPLKMHASQMEIDSDIVLGNTNKIVTSQITADDLVPSS